MITEEELIAAANRVGREGRRLEEGPLSAALGWQRYFEEREPLGYARPLWFGDRLVICSVDPWP